MFVPLCLQSLQVFLSHTGEKKNKNVTVVFGLNKQLTFLLWMYFSFGACVCGSAHSSKPDLRAQHAHLLKQPNIPQPTKIKAWKVVVLANLFCWCETPYCSKEVKQLEQFSTGSLRSICSISWAGLSWPALLIEAMILKAQLQWSGHAIRMDDGDPETTA